MTELVLKVVASVVAACLFCTCTFKMVGAMKQAGYKNGVFWRWLKRKDNLGYNRLAVFALCLGLSTAIVSLCFSFLGVAWALAISAVPFALLSVFFCWADGKYALKVKTVRTGRLCRLFGVYLFFVAAVGYILIALLGFLKDWNGSELYGLVAYVPFAIMPLILPALLCLANAVTGVFENARNKKFVKGAGTVLNETEIIRVGVVGSYGKTSVKNILKTLLEEKYSVVETPASYNTPVGIAKTVVSPAFKGKQVFIAEIGARKTGDVAELCVLVKPDYAVFTGVCEQHIQTFGSLENVLKEKSEILRCGAKKVVCGNGLRGMVEDNETVAFACATKDIQTALTGTRFVLTLGGEEIAVNTKLLGSGAVENISLAATLAYEMGLTVAEIARGIEKLQPVPHRLQLLENGGVYILDDGYNCNIVGAKAALSVLSTHAGRKCVVTPGIVECGVLEEQVNGELGAALAAAKADLVILVGQTLVQCVKEGYLQSGGETEKLKSALTLADGQTILAEWVQAGDAVLFLNDLPDVY
ncbi:MAG: UDP-N-acetylmuramoyl-tripeptide--D-alanyl-D-alanine ligase [Clostridia bacterium]|nr:UDP-N-acetylmuramoyl-tripeptide--D-alanyl-D-alanine ligase [Clostridia bacterium]